MAAASNTIVWNGFVQGFQRCGQGSRRPLADFWYGPGQAFDSIARCFRYDKIVLGRRVIRAWYCCDWVRTESVAPSTSLCLFRCQRSSKTASSRAWSSKLCNTFPFLWSSVQKLLHSFSGIDISERRKPRLHIALDGNAARCFSVLDEAAQFLSTGARTERTSAYVFFLEMQMNNLFTARHAPSFSYQLSDGFGTQKLNFVSWSELSIVADSCFFAGANVSGLLLFALWFMLQ